jgi:ABC-type thiamine transport system ATPase subunit
MKRILIGLGIVLAIAIGVVLVTAAMRPDQFSVTRSLRIKAAPEKLAALVAERTGAALGWLLVDEAFDGLDQPSRERCLEMVQAFAQERGVLVLLVTHSCEVQEALSGVISVEVGPEGSRVQVMES